MDTRQLTGARVVTCTIGPSATTGKRCGKPAVRAWMSEGRLYAECAEHDAGARMGEIAVRGIEEGAMVIVKAYGGSYQARVVKVGRTRARVRITLQSGREKVIERPLADMTRTEGR